MLKDLFGGKKWFQSLTAWGLVVLAVGNAAAVALASSGLVSHETATTLTSVVDWVGGVATALGIRRAATARR